MENLNNSKRVQQSIQYTVSINNINNERKRSHSSNSSISSISCSSGDSGDSEEYVATTIKRSKKFFDFSIVNQSTSKDNEEEEESNNWNFKDISFERFELSAKEVRSDKALFFEVKDGRANETFPIKSSFEEGSFIY
jgi:hypothetical protein